MSDDVSRQEFEALKERVAALETDGTATVAPDGLDHRDRAVLDYMREHGRASKRQLVKLYIRLTDVTTTETAKQRAKMLEQHGAYEEL